MSMASELQEATSILAAIWEAYVVACERGNHRVVVEEELCERIGDFLEQSETYEHNHQVADTAERLSVAASHGFSFMQRIGASLIDWAAKRESNIVYREHMETVQPPSTPTEEGVEAPAPERTYQPHMHPAYAYSYSTLLDEINQTLPGMSDQTLMHIKANMEHILDSINGRLDKRSQVQAQNQESEW